jgi:hypothetical protein
MLETIKRIPSAIVVTFEQRSLKAGWETITGRKWG